MAASIESYRDLLPWQHSFKLGLAVYTLTERFPSSEQFGLTHQMRRSALSVASNIAEGHSRVAMTTTFAFSRSPVVRSVTWKRRRFSPFNSGTLLPRTAGRCLPIWKNRRNSLRA